MSLRHTVKKHIRLAAVPHANNAHRPYAVRRTALAVMIVALFGANLFYNSTQSGDVLGKQAAITSPGLLQDTNDSRRAEGLNDVRISDKLTRAAQAKAKDMFANQYWAHVSPSGIQPWRWLGDSGYEYSQAGENLAKGFTTDGSVSAAWMASPEHRRNILEPAYSDVGFAVMEGSLLGKDTTIVVAMYGAPAQAGTVTGLVTGFNQATTAIGIVGRIGQTVQALPAVAVGSVVIIGSMILIALSAHFARRRLPIHLQQGWYRHHGLYKAGGLAGLSVMIVIMYSGGQI